MAFLGSLCLRNIKFSFSSVAHAGEADPTGPGLPIPAAVLFLQADVSLSLLPYACSGS